MIDVYVSDEYEEGFKITSDKQADRIIEEMKEIEQEHNRLIDLAEAKIVELHQKIADLNLDRDMKTSWHKVKLNEYMRTVETKSTKTQDTYKLLSGALKIKRKAPTPIKDDTKLLEWLKSQNMKDYITEVEKVEWGYLKKELIQTDKGFVTKDGVIVEGVTLQENEDVFIVE